MVRQASANTMYATGSTTWSGPRGSACSHGEVFASRLPGASADLHQACGRCVVGSKKTLSTHTWLEYSLGAALRKHNVKDFSEH